MSGPAAMDVLDFPHGVARGAAVRTAPWRAERRLARIARSGKPIVAGPWLSEVGIELLFWIPFLNWFRDRYGIERERLIAISRGGADPWYAHLVASYLDVHERFEPEATRAWAEQRVRETRTQKQTRIADHDREVLAWASERIDGEFELLHPSLMHTAFRPFWAFDSEICRLSTVLDRTRFELFVPPEPLDGLPERYVAVKAYFNQVLPESEQNRSLLAELIARLTERTDVVLLSTGLELDDHEELRAVDAARIHRIDDRVTARNNLEVQTRAIAGAQASIGTYGGLTYLGPLLGVPSFSLYANEDFNPTHRDIIHRAVRSLDADGQGAGYVTLPVSSATALLDLSP